VRGLTAAERNILSMSDDECVDDDALWHRVTPGLVAAGRAVVKPDPIYEASLSVTDLGALALRVCPVGEP
jgi:hypothetical protein